MTAQRWELPETGGTRPGWDDGEGSGIEILMGLDPTQHKVFAGCQAPCQY